MRGTVSGPGVRNWLARLWTNDVETGATASYPDVRPLELAIPPSAAYAAAIEAARAMPRWTLLKHDAGARRIRAEARTKRMEFVDDVEVWIEPVGGRASRVRARSGSRVGFTDFGTNARRLRAYLARVAEIARAQRPSGPSG